ncbi:hypothetical protein BS47DRAFT_1074125 [Hydnum rufescens UP504]|uniref:Uncharacterized protein n=1 Tax=Hydnum rufescens UP504 TaxID=1448309 RepID=A0A9P6B8B9_9AGAM|nr:hypothetical protein BS47DRAFT_1074125 [Hydnum rufescens UP504]
MAITIGKIRSNTLLHGLNSRQGQQTNWRDSRSTPESDTIQSMPPRWQRNPPVQDDDLGIEFADIGRSGYGSGILSLVFEQDIMLVQITEEKVIGEVGDHLEPLEEMDTRVKNADIDYSAIPQSRLTFSSEKTQT